MNKDLQLFTNVINHLIFFTTKDEYGSSRSKGIDNLADFADELNNAGINASKGQWNENSLAIHFYRIKKKYPLSVLKSECDFDLVGKSSWEYLSGEYREQKTIKRKCCIKGRKQQLTESYPLISYEPVEGEMWKESELEEILGDEKRFIRKITQISKSKKEKEKNCPK